MIFLFEIKDLRVLGACISNIFFFLKVAHFFFDCFTKDSKGVTNFSDKKSNSDDKITEYFIDLTCLPISNNPKIC